MQPLAATLTSSPELFPIALNLGTGEVTFIRLLPAEFERASFLDGRIGLGRPGRTIAWQHLARLVDEANLAESCHYIFHLGHVGSTLLSRLLGKHERLFSLREPEILRTLALARDATLAESHLPVFLKLWSRTFATGQRALIKATSFTSDLAAPILGRSCQPRALLIGVRPETYLATIFGGANTPAEAKALAPFRLARLRTRLGATWSAAPTSAGEMIAMSWACEALALTEAATIGENRVRVLDFDRFLGDPRTTLAEAFAHFGIAIDEGGLEPILSGREMQTYSKAPEHAYDTALRTAVLNEGRLRHASEIGRGLSWLERLAGENPQLAHAMTLFA